MQNRYIKLISLSLVVLLIAGIFIYRMLPNKSQAEVAEASPSPAEQPAMEVNMFVAKSVELDHYINVTGTTLADEEVVLSTEVSGLLTHIYFDEGKVVNRGQLLAKINDAELQAQLKRANHELALAELKLNRQKQLLEREGISQQEFDNTEAEVNIIHAEIELIQSRIRQTEIRAPFDGVTGLRKVSPGKFVSPGTEVVSLVKVQPLKIDFQIPQVYATRIISGTPFRFQLNTQSPMFTGEIYATESMIDPSTRSLTARGLYPNENHEFLPGAFVNVEVQTESMDDAIIIPTISIVPVLGGQQVYLVKDGKVKPNPVKTGLRMSDQIHITEGVEAGDTILTSGLLQVRPGMEVRPGVVEIAKSENE